MPLSPLKQQEFHSALYGLLGSYLSLSWQSEEEDVEDGILSWLECHKVPLGPVCADDKPLAFSYSPNGQLVSIRLHVMCDDKPLTIIAGAPVLLPVKEVHPASTQHDCGFCGASYPTTADLYAHQSRAHDPDGIMFSELGLPK